MEVGDPTGQEDERTGGGQTQDARERREEAVGASASPCFGNWADSVPRVPWLCVPVSRRGCLCRSSGDVLTLQGKAPFGCEGRPVGR